MLDKLKQQLVDEKLKAQNLVADACAAEKRADGLAKVKDENRELSRQIQQLKNEQASQSGNSPRVTQLQDELTQKENEISKLLEQIRKIQSEVNNDEQHSAEGKVKTHNHYHISFLVDSLKKQMIEVQIQRDQLQDVEEAHQRRIQHDQAVYNDRMDQLTKEKDLANKGCEIVETQFANLKTLHEKLTSDMEMLMKDRESQRKENRTLRTEISSGQAFIDKLQKEKVFFNNFL